MLIIQSRIQTSLFCTPQDEVYQAILANIKNWTDYFPNPEPVLIFETASGKAYAVNAVYWKTKEQSPILFIPTVPKTRELLGYAGYAYSLDGAARPDGRYTSEHLANHIYCYHFVS